MLRPGKRSRDPETKKNNVNKRHRSIRIGMSLGTRQSGAAGRTITRKHENVSRYIIDRKAAAWRRAPGDGERLTDARSMTRYVPSQK